MRKNTRCPVISTYKAKGVFPESDTLSIGAAGLSPKADAIILPFVRSADLVILAGYDPIEMRTGWRDPWPSGTPVIEFAAAPNTHYVHQATHNFVCDTGEGLSALGAGVAPWQTWPDGEVAAVKLALKEAFPSDEEWGPAAVIDEGPKGASRWRIERASIRSVASYIAQPDVALRPGAALADAVFGLLHHGMRAADGDRPKTRRAGAAGCCHHGRWRPGNGDGRVGNLTRFTPAGGADRLCRPFAGTDRTEAAQQGDCRTPASKFGGTDFAGLADVMGGVGVTVSDRAALSAAVYDGLNRDTFTLIACMIGDKPYDGRF